MARTATRGKIQQVVLNKGWDISERDVKADIIEGKRIIEGAHFIRPIRPPKEHLEPSGPFGGQMKNVPEDCPFGRRDKEALWADTICCVASCKNPECEAYKLLMEGQKTRIKLMMSDPCAKECPHCKSSKASHSQEMIETTYVCGTVGNRITQTYEYKCKRPVRPQRPARRARG